MHIEWLRYLKSGNDDDPAFYKILAERETGKLELTVSTNLDCLADHFLKADGNIHSVLLVAHAGDGKSHFIRRVGRRFQEDGVMVHRFPEDGSSLDTPGLHVLNDPSPLERSVTARFFRAAFGPMDSRPTGCKYIAAANRGFLREVTVELSDESSAHDWLRDVQVQLAVAHRVDAHGRVAVPLDQRTLVPGPGDEKTLRASKVWMLANTILAGIRVDLEHEGFKCGWEPATWSDRVAVALAVAETAGHHVTFRECMALTAAIGEALATEEKDEFAALFQDINPLLALENLFRLLRRMDPARVSIPQIDLEAEDLEQRNGLVRQHVWDTMVALFKGGQVVPDARYLPYRTAPRFIKLCGEVGRANRAALSTLDGLRQLRMPCGPASHERDVASILQKAEQSLVSVSVVPEALDGDQVLSDLFAGLSNVAWGADAGRSSHPPDVMPLSTPIQPGTVAGTKRWRVLRAAVARDRIEFVIDTVDPGPYVEKDLVLPLLVIRGPKGLQDSPPLPLDLELFETLVRIGQTGGGTRELGARESQVTAWLDAVVAGWEEAWSEHHSGFVVFQTLISDRPQDSVPLRPPSTGERVVRRDSPIECLPRILEDLLHLWPEKAEGRNSVAFTPSACASGLLVWAGFEPDPRRSNGTNHPALREALGAGSVDMVRQRERLISFAFPWSTHTLGLGMERNSPPFATDEIRRVGRVCAHALGLDEGPQNGYSAALQSAWAVDERSFDNHPSALLAHQWLNAGLEGRQLEGMQGHGAPSAAQEGLRKEVLWELLDPSVPFSAQLRWWLIGTWAAWWTFLCGLQELHATFLTPVLLPYVEDGDQSEYRRLWSAWFDSSSETGSLNAVLSVGQASGFLAPAALLRRFELVQGRPGGLTDIIRLLSHHVCIGEHVPTERTIKRLQENLLEAGLYMQKGGTPIRERLPVGAITSESPSSSQYEETLRRTLMSLSILDSASDGAELIRSPWQEPQGKR